MKKVVNEKEYAEYCLENNYIDNKKVKTLVILIKYWHKEGHSKETVINKLDEFMTKADGEYKLNNWEEKFYSLAKQYCSDDYILSEVTEIYVTKKEMDTILKNRRIEVQRVLFSLLVNCKIRNAMKQTSTNRVKTPTKEIFSDAKVNKNNRDKELMIATLKKLELVECPLVGTDIILKYIDLDYNSEDVAITITSFNDFILDYYKYIGNKVIKCKECGDRVLVKGNASTKYCHQCSKKVKLRQTRECKSRKKTEKA